MTIEDIGDVTSFKWATVTAISPLAIRMDGDTVALALVPESLVDPLSLSVGSRVRVELTLRKVVIHGAAGGASSLPAGTIAQFAGFVAPTGYLLCQGQSLVRATYPTLYSALFASMGTVTVTIAAPGVFTKATHGLQIGDSVYLTTTGALPTGIAANVNYYVATVPTTSTFTLTASLTRTVNGRTVGTAITTSGSQSGVHSLYEAPYGFASATTFYLPDMRGRVAVGGLTGDTDLGTLGADNLASAKTHTLTSAQMPVHTHVQNAHSHGNPVAVTYGGDAGNYRSIFATNSAFWSMSDANNQTAVATATNQNAGSGGSHNNLQPYLVLNFIIKT